MNSVLASALALATLGCMISSAPAHAAKGGVPASPAKAPESPAEKVVWDYWYTITLNGKDHYGYYNDRVIIRGDRLHYLNRTWKKEEDFINEEQLGAFASNTPDLSPLFYNFRSVYRSTETIIDGNVSPDGVFTVKVRRGQTEQAPVRKTLRSKTFLSVFFPVWLGQQLPTLKENQTRAFSAILEDKMEEGFPSTPGNIRRLKDDDIAKKTKSTKIQVDYNGMKSFWWVDKSGAPLRIENPLQKMVVERTTQAAAEKSLAEK